MHDRKIKAAERKAAVKAQLKSERETVLACGGGNLRMPDDDARARPLH
jgi:hypothetical protein